ncbi:MAG: FtsX-like permease family protein [Chloroflexi bacterium]|nr:FtsX-like permease family protein [Chloroflexota bacterium]
MFALFRKAYRDLTQRRVRSLLTLGAIAIGVAGIVAIVSTAQNLTRAQAAAYQNTSQADITFWVWNAPPKTERALLDISNVAAAELRNNYFTKCKWNGEYRDVYVWGIQDFSDQQINQIRLLDNLPKPGEFVAETSVRELFPVRVGDTISCRARDGSSQTLTLAGFATSPNYPSATILNWATVYANASDVQKLLGISGANQALLKVQDLAKLNDTAREAARLFNRRSVEHAAPTLRDPNNYLGKRELDALFLLLTVFSIVGLVTSGFLVANTLAAMTTEQIGEIGVVKAIGGTRWQVLTIYIIAAILYGIIGTLIGIAFGALASWRLLLYIGSLLNLDVAFSISSEGVALGAGVGIGVTIIGGLIPSLAGTGIRVKDALEAYGITSTYGQGRVDRLMQRWVALPPLAAMSLRNLARRKTRSLITTLVIAVAVAASLAAQSTSTSVDAAIDGLFQTYRADAWASFDQWVGTNFAGNLRAADGVQAVEVWSIGDAWVSDPIPHIAPVRARLWGVPATTTMYIPQLVEGRWYRADETDGVVISTDLQQELKLRAGDFINVEIGKAQRNFKIVGVVIDNSIFLGSTVAGKVFVPEDLVEKMQQREGWATFFAFSFDAHDPASVEKRLGEMQAKFRQYQMGTDSAYREVAGAKEQSRILSLALYAMSLIIGAIGALGVLNTLTLNVLERRREIGVLRSIGAANENLVQVFLTEGLALGLGGWVIGILIGYPMGQLLINLMQSILFHINYIFSAQMILASLLFALVLSIAASLIPALGAARLRVSQVLRYE